MFERQSRYRSFLPLLIALIVGGFMIWSGITPVSRSVWYAELIPIFAIFALLVLTYPFFQFSRFSYFLMSCLLILHSIGAHYTFANVPFDWGNQILGIWLGEGRNHFDRLGHFTVGFYAYPMAELLLRKRLATPLIAGLFGLFFIMSVAASYELIEWQYAVIAGGEEGIAFLGSQGDIWDAQKDILADTLGALFALILFFIVRPERHLN